MSANLFFYVLPFTLDNLEIILTVGYESKLDNSQNLHEVAYIGIKSPSIRLLVYIYIAFLLTHPLCTLAEAAIAYRQERFILNSSLIHKERKLFKNEYIKVKELSQDAALNFQSINQI